MEAPHTEAVLVDDVIVALELAGHLLNQAVNDRDHTSIHQSLR